MSGTRIEPRPGDGFEEAYEQEMRSPDKRPTLSPVPRRNSPGHIKAMVKERAWQVRARRELDMALREFHDFDAALVAVFVAGVHAAAEVFSEDPPSGPRGGS